MSRRPRNDDSSLELLLDTICNMFGGIVFISLLVVLLLQTTSEQRMTAAPDGKSELQLLEADIERAELTTKLKTAREAMRRAEAVADVLPAGEISRLARELQSQRKRRAEQVAIKSSQLAKVTKVQRDRNRVAVEDAQRTARITGLKRELAKIEQQVKAVRAERSETVNVRQLLDNGGRQPMSCWLRYGKLFGPNPDDFVVTEGLDAKTREKAQIVNAVPSRGVPVDPTGKNLAALMRKFREVSPADSYIQLFVWPDSYPHFDVVRKAYEKAGFRCALEPMDQDDPVYLGPPRNYKVQ